jgi:hypothetical protein
MTQKDKLTNSDEDKWEREMQTIEQNDTIWNAREKE